MIGIDDKNILEVKLIKPICTQVFVINERVMAYLRGARGGLILAKLFKSYPDVYNQLNFGLMA